MRPLGAPWKLLIGVLDRRQTFCYGARARDVGQRLLSARASAAPASSVQTVWPPGIEPGTICLPQTLYSQMLYQLSYSQLDFRHEVAASSQARLRMLAARRLPAMLSPTQCLRRRLRAPTAPDFFRPPKISGSGHVWSRMPQK